MHTGQLALFSPPRSAPSTARQAELARDDTDIARARVRAALTPGSRLLCMQDLEGDRVYGWLPDAMRAELIAELVRQGTPRRLVAA